MPEVSPAGAAAPVRAGDHRSIGARHVTADRPTVGPRAGALLGVLLALLLVPIPAHAADQYGVEVTNMRSGLKADVMWASTAPYQGVFLWPNNTSASQEFDLLDSGGGYFRIRAPHSGQCLMLDWRGGSYVNGTPVIQYPYCSAGYAPAEWRRGWVSVPPQCSGDCLQHHRDAVPGLGQPPNQPLSRRAQRLGRRAARPSRAAAVGLHPFGDRLERRKPVVAYRQRGLPLTTKASLVGGLLRRSRIRSGPDGRSTRQQWPVLLLSGFRRPPDSERMRPWLIGDQDTSVDYGRGCPWNGTVG